MSTYWLWPGGSSQICQTFAHLVVNINSTEIQAIYGTKDFWYLYLFKGLRDFYKKVSCARQSRRMFVWSFCFWISVLNLKSTFMKCFSKILLKSEQRIFRLNAWDENSSGLKIQSSILGSKYFPDPHKSNLNLSSFWQESWESQVLLFKL